MLFLIFGFGTNIPVFADRYAVVICKVNERGHLLVDTADVDVTCGLSGVGQKSRPCAQVLSEVSSKGYELFDVISQETQINLPAFYVFDVEDTKRIEELMATIEREVKVESKLIFILQCKNDGKE
jgi:hypothetical protein